jgi:hypothetical protein
MSIGAPSRTCAATNITRLCEETAWLVVLSYLRVIFQERSLLDFALEDHFVAEGSIVCCGLLGNEEGRVVLGLG